MYFDKEVIFLNQNMKNKEQVITTLSNQLSQKDIVSNRFLENILTREKEFPTGLSVNQTGFAIPHTDSIYVNHAQIAVMTLEKPVTFFEMGTLDKPVEVSLVFLLALKQPHEQLEMLQTLITLFQNENIIKELLSVQSNKHFLSILHSQKLF